jgi:hypothetical protein
MDTDSHGLEDKFLHWLLHPLSEEFETHLHPWFLKFN